MFSYVLLNEYMTSHQLVGASLILAAMLTASTDKSVVVEVSEK
ncbi:MAG: hypothetical protein QXV34_07230 [Sulfolobales archaeon]